MNWNVKLVDKDLHEMLWPVTGVNSEGQAMRAAEYEAEAEDITGFHAVFAKVCESNGETKH